MALPEKLYDLRKKSGLSQEQLAERLGVSRQSVSKWESGRSVPEGDKLIAISECFNVSLDYLMRDGAEPPVSEERGGEQPRANMGTGFFAGLAVCLAGAVGLILWGLLFLLDPSASDRIGQSSAVTLDGNGIILALCVAAIFTGAVLLLKQIRKK